MKKKIMCTFKKRKKQQQQQRKQEKQESNKQILGKKYKKQVIVLSHINQAWIQQSSFSFKNFSGRRCYRKTM